MSVNSGPSNLLSSVCPPLPPPPRAWTMASASTAPSRLRPNDAAKGKNHPSFTIILRRQLPMQWSDEAPENEIGATSGCQSAEHETNIQLDEPELVDFILDYPWQIWLLANESEPVTEANWNVQKHGPLASTGSQFWKAYSALIDRAEQVKNLMIFRDQIEPKWEDESNLNGGRWFFDISYSKGVEAKRECLTCANYWTKSLQLVLSGCLNEGAKLIVGLILHFKPAKYRVSFWINSSHDFNQVIHLGTELRNALELKCKLKFELHSASAGTAASDRI